MSDETAKPELHFHDQIDYYDTTDFAQLTAEVSNDGWIGAGDAMATFALLRPDSTVEQVYIPVNVDNGPVTRGSRVTFPIENVTRSIHGETRVSMTELSGADFVGAYEWSAWYAPIRDPFEESR